LPQQPANARRSPTDCGADQKHRQPGRPPSSRIGDGDEYFRYRRGRRSVGIAVGTRHLAVGLSVQQAGSRQPCDFRLGLFWAGGSRLHDHYRVFVERQALASAQRLIATGLCDAAVVGGADTLCKMTIQGFDSLEALAPDYCNPFSRNRDGINIGEGAAVFLMSREPSPVALLGSGESSDAYHVSAPDPEGTGAALAMCRALEHAGLAPEAIGYINLHGTATPLNDAMEGCAVAKIFGGETPCSSTKAMTGNMLGAAGAVEAAFLWLTLEPQFATGLVPPHLWDGAADPAIPSVNLAPAGCRIALSDRCAVLSNSFAFGGSNASVILGRGW